MDGVTIIGHPLVRHKLALMRDARTSTKTFRQLMREASALICYEVTRDLPVEPVEVQTPMGVARGEAIAGKKLVFAPILRAGMGMLEGMLDMVPAARVAHVGLYRDPQTLGAVEYYYKAPEDVAERLVVVLSPMTATGHTALAAVDRLKEHGATDLRYATIVASRQGLETFRAHHPDVPVWAAAVDEGLDPEGYILPGLGDAGDRMYGTR
jgi:uracil phosphoribosyltransferase